jgi:uncharacterized protein (TIGR00297 family)
VSLLIYLIITLNAIIAAAAYRRKSVSRSGGMLGAVVGAGIWLAGGLMLWLLLAFFFASSTMFSKLGVIKKRSLKIIHAKSDVRDGIQVLANGGIPLVTAALYGIFADPVFLIMFAASLASATADTWASEVGFLSKRDPISITTGTRVKPGISGGITPLGTCMACLGAFAAAIVFSWSLSVMELDNLSAGMIVTIITISGFLGTLVDSLLGATIQAHYIHQEKQIITERSSINGITLSLYRGYPWITNDTVNALSGAAAALIAAGMYFLLVI